MNEKTYRISGRVVDRTTGRGVPGLRVEAWDRDTRYHDLLGEKVTGGEGQFQVSFDESYFGDYAPDVAPDLFFRIFQGEQLVKSTEGTVMVNVAAGDTEVTIPVDMGTEAEAKADRVSSRQVLNSLSWAQKSDFRGVGRETGTSLRTMGRFLTDTVRARLREVDVAPLRPGSIRTNQVVDQDVATATRNLEKRDVTVNQVQTYRPGEGGQTLRSIQAFPSRLRSGDKVNLYEENGTVRYYSVEREGEKKGEKVEGEVAEARPAGAEVEGLRREMAELKDQVTARDQEIASLRDELSAVKGREEDVQELRTQLQDVQRKMTRLSENG